MTERMKAYVDRGERPLFIPFITAGDPTPAATIDIALLLQASGANAIEIGIPYSDPLADGPVIQEASKRALSQGMTLEKAMMLVSQMREQGLKIPVIIFTYYNLLLQLGEDAFFVWLIVTILTVCLFLIYLLKKASLGGKLVIHGSLLLYRW